jgi:hypothetical protein
MVGPRPSLGGGRGGKAMGPIRTRSARSVGPKRGPEPEGSSSQPASQPASQEGGPGCPAHGVSRPSRITRICPADDSGRRPSLSDTVRHSLAQSGTVRQRAPTTMRRHGRCTRCKVASEACPFFSTASASTQSIHHALPGGSVAWDGARR